MSGLGNEKAAGTAARGRLRASDADREQTIGTLKAAFVQGRLTKDEFDARIAQTLAARTYAELATVTSDIPAPPSQPRPGPPRRRPGNAVRWGTSGFVAPALVAVAFALASGGKGAYGAVVFVMAFVYFVFWLSAGADLLWEWHCMSLPTAQLCVRCAHTFASHRAPASCTVRLGSLRMSCCPCTGYVPPGLSPEAFDLRVPSTRHP
ncbi:MAG: DUF1707 domain-containing protein [Actinobacteria bacterium]|nr:DUF1707 domain-containing protein [Actinomycetota bacterium]